jgi:hypothetical protein
MQIDFKALEQALAPIAEIGQGELTFDAGGTQITLRVLRPAEEVEAQKFAAVALEGEADHAAVDYLDRFRLACLSHAIVAVGSQDFRNVDYVTTGETLDNGVAVKVPKHKALQMLLARWTRAALAGVFTKFHELLTRTELDAEKAIIFEPANIPSEIDRLNQRITELRSEMEKATAVEKTKFSETVSRVEAQVASQMQVPVPEKVETQEPISEPTPVRRAGPVIPQQAAPPMERPTTMAPPPRVDAPVSAPPPSRADSSFVDTADDDSMNAAMNAEHQRLMDMRQRAFEGRSQSDGSALDTIHPQLQQRRRPPHQDAFETEEDVGLTAALAQRARELSPTADGIPVFAMPAQDLDVPMTQIRPDKRALNPQIAHGGSTNPRFQGARKP